jgi:hypothetical protein
MKAEETIAKVKCFWGERQWFGGCQCCSCRPENIMVIEFDHNQIRLCEDCARALTTILNDEIPR